MKTKTFNIGIIGFGSIGRRHFNNLKKTKNILSIYTSQNIVLKNTHIYKDIKSLIKNNDVIFICSRSNQHYEHLKICLNHNKHVYCEKPLTLSSIHLKNLTKHINFKKILIFPGYQLRSSDLLEKFKSIKKNYNLGKMISYSGYVGQNIKSWRSNIDYKLSNTFVEKNSGGILFELIHDIDLIYQLTNKEVKSYNSLKVKSIFKKLTCDNIGIIFKLETNIIGSLQLDYINIVPTRIVNLVFSKYNIFIDFNKSYIKINSNNFEKKFIVKQNRNNIFIKHINNFFELISNKKKFNNLSEFQRNISYTRLIEKINEN